MHLNYINEKWKENLERQRGTKWVGPGGEKEKESPDARPSAESVRGLEFYATVGEASAMALHRSLMPCISCTLPSLYSLPPFLYSQVSTPQISLFDLKECGCAIKIGWAQWANGKLREWSPSYHGAHLPHQLSWLTFVARIFSDFGEIKKIKKFVHHTTNRKIGDGIWRSHSQSW